MRVQPMIRELEKIASSGHSAREIYYDWLLSLWELFDNHDPATWGEKAHDMQSVMKAVEDNSDDVDNDKRRTSVLHKQYKEYHWKHFSAATVKLLEIAAAEPYADLLGEIFMEYANPNARNGQFFTPGPVADMMAMMNMGDIEAQIESRIAEALEHVPDEIKRIENNRQDEFLLELARHYRPITVNDPACGSGVMLLSAAKMCPAWAVQGGFVRFYGNDIDGTCVLMARCNMALYGINGSYLKHTIRRFNSLDPLEASREILSMDDMSLEAGAGVGIPISEVLGQYSESESVEAV